MQLLVREAEYQRYMRQQTERLVMFARQECETLREMNAALRHQVATYAAVLRELRKAGANAGLKRGWEAPAVQSMAEVLVATESVEVESKKNKKKKKSTSVHEGASSGAVADNMPPILNTDGLDLEQLVSLPDDVYPQHLNLE